MIQTKIVHVITGTALGGAEIMLFRYLRALENARHNHLVVSMMPCGPVAEMIRDLGVRVIGLDAGSARRIPQAVSRLNGIVADVRPMVLHGWMYHGSLLATLALRMGRRPDIGLVWGIHHSLSNPAREKPMTRTVLRGLRWMSGRADLITYCSQLSASQHTGFGFPQELTRFVPNAIDMDEFRPDPAAHTRLCAVAGIASERQIIGTFARAHPMKDHVTFARTIARLAACRTDVHGVLIGQGQPDGAAIREARRYGIADRLTALPPRDDIAQLVPGLDLYLLSSAWGEALPLAVAEAMAAGIPPVVTDIGDCRWLVGNCGKICPPGQPDALAEACADLLSLSENARVRLSQACRIRIMKNMSMDDYITHHDLIYRQAHARRQTPSAGWRHMA
ncbi:MAG: glycosyltransferase [Paracoccus sp. (in: a-proteobacteria)]